MDINTQSCYYHSLTPRPGPLFSNPHAGHLTVFLTFSSATMTTITSVNFLFDSLFLQMIFFYCDVIRDIVRLAAYILVHVHNNSHLNISKGTYTHESFFCMKIDKNILMKITLLTVLFCTHPPSLLSSACH